MQETKEIGFDSTFSLEAELETLLMCYKDCHNKFVLDEKQREKNESERQTTEIALYNFNVGFLLGMRCRK